MKRGDFVFVDFPFADASFTKKRPAVVLLADTFGALPDTILASMSTAAHGRGYSRHDRSRHGPTFRILGPYRIRREKLYAVEKTVLHGTTGSLSKTTMLQLDACLRSVLGL